MAKWAKAFKVFGSNGIRYLIRYSLGGGSGSGLKIEFDRGVIVGARQAISEPADLL